MCPPENNKCDISRRTFLKGVGASLAAAPFLTGLAGCSSAESAQSDKKASTYHTRLVLLGTMGGVSYWPDSNRTSSSSALIVGDAVYLIDVGQGATYRLNEALNTESMVTSDGKYTGAGSSTFLQNVKALFLTHLHQDHLADYPNLLLIGNGAGLGTPPNPLKVIGPCDRGQLDINKSGFDETKIIYTDSADPGKITPTPGARQMTDTIWQAFAQTINDLTLDDAYPDFRSRVEVTEIGVPLASKDSPTCPVTEPFLIYPADKNGVSVQATLVDHHQVYPAFAFRFYTPDGSVVFSGDTGPDTNGNLQKLAAGADILVHEVIDTAWVNYKFGENPKEGSWQYTLRQHMLTSHTPIEAVGAVARDCNVKTLVLNHIVPAMTPISHLLQAQRNFSGNLIIGEDLMQIGVGKPAA